MKLRESRQLLGQVRLIRRELGLPCGRWLNSRQRFAEFVRPVGWIPLWRVQGDRNDRDGGDATLVRGGDGYALRVRTGVRGSGRFREGSEEDSGRGRSRRWLLWE